MKRCSTCNIVKVLADFHKKVATKDWHTGKCKACISAYNKEYRLRLTAAEKAILVKRTAEYHKANPDKKAASNSKWKAANKGAVNASTAKRYTCKLERTPKWVLNDPDELWLIQQFYIRARELTISTGVKHHVDHIYPLQGKTVSGFHCWQNLQILTESENTSKGNSMPTQGQ